MAPSTWHGNVWPARYCTNFSRSEPLEEAIKVSVTAKPTYAPAYLSRAKANSGLDPDNLPAIESPGLYRNREDRPKTWKEIWGAGQGVGNIDDVPGVAELVDRLEKEYVEARRKLFGA